jgi:hypothetical protein
MIQNIITTKLTISLIITTVLVTSGTTIFPANAQQTSSSSSSSPTPPSIILQKNVTEVRVQKTVMSIPAPSANINNQTIPHQIVIALPLIEDSKIWTGTATFTASKPIEIELLHRYNLSTIPDAKHGQPYNAKWIDGSPIALSTMTMFSNTPVSVTNTPISTGSFVFSGSALIFHKTDGQPFSVTYTVDAVAKTLTER